MVAYALVALSMTSRLLLGAFLWLWPAVHVLASGNDTWLLSFIGSRWLLIFWFGVVLGQFLAGVRLHRGLALAWGIGWFALALAARQGGYSDEATEELTYGLAFCGLIIAVRSAAYADVPQWLGAFVRSGSDASYATFLFHIGIVSAGCRLVNAAGLEGAAGHLACVLLCLVASFAVGVWVNRHIEPRIAHFLNRRGAQDAVAAPAGNT